MSKNVNTTKVATNATPAAPTVFNLREAMEKYPNVSLRKLATACELSYGWILKKSKEPVEGMPWDPNFVNYEAVAQTFTKKGIDLATLDWESLDEAVLRRGVQLTKNMDAFRVGGEIYLREDNTVPFVICYKTDTHIVIMKKGSTEPRAWSHATFLMKGPVFEPRTVDSLEDPIEESAPAAETVEEPKPTKKSRKAKEEAVEA